MKTWTSYVVAGACVATISMAVVANAVNEDAQRHRIEALEDRVNALRSEPVVVVPQAERADPRLDMADAKIEALESRLADLCYALQVLVRQLKWQGALPGRASTWCSVEPGDHHGEIESLPNWRHYGGER